MITNPACSSGSAAFAGERKAVMPRAPRPQARGKFLFVGEEKFYVRGVTYGPFRPESDGCGYHQPELVKRDFALMQRKGINAVRLYTPPPRWFLDLAAEHD